MSILDTLTHISIATVHQSDIIVDAGNHTINIHGSKTLDEVVGHLELYYRENSTEGVSNIKGATAILPKALLKWDSAYQRSKKRKLCRRRAAIHPLIGHLKSDV